MNKGLTITLIVLLSILLFSLIGVMIFLLNGNVSFNVFSIASGQSQTLVEEKEISNIKDLKINADVADVKIEESDSNTIKVELYSEDSKEHEITENDNEIKIVLNTSKKINFGIFSKTPNIRIYIPSTYNKDITINDNTGDITVGNFNNANLKVKGRTGDIVAEALNNVDIYLTTGDVKIDEVNEIVSENRTGDHKIVTAKNVKISTTTGDIKVEKSVNKIETKTTTGDVKIGDVNYSIKVSSNTGDVHIDKAVIKENSSIEVGTGDVYIGTANGCYVDGSSRVGDVNVNNSSKDRKSDIELKIKARTGDIRVN